MKHGTSCVRLRATLKLILVLVLTWINTKQRMVNCFLLFLIKKQTKQWIAHNRTPNQHGTNPSKYYHMNCFQINFSVRPSTKTMFGGSHQQLDAATTRCRTIRHLTPNMFYALTTQPNLIPQSNSQPRWTLKSMGLLTLTTFGLCCLLWCTIIKD